MPQAPHKEIPQSQDVTPHVGLLIRYRPLFTHLTQCVVPLDLAQRVLAYASLSLNTLEPFGRLGLVSPISALFRHDGCFQTKIRFTAAALFHNDILYYKRALFSSSVKICRTFRLPPQSYRNLQSNSSQSSAPETPTNPISSFPLQYLPY